MPYATNMPQRPSRDEYADEVSFDKLTGGPASPFIHHEPGVKWVEKGATLRDMFATAIVPALIQAGELTAIAEAVRDEGTREGVEFRKRVADILAEDAYVIAEAMVARSRR